MQHKFIYNKNIDTQVRIAVSKALKTEVFLVKRMTQGEVNHVYAINTNSGKVLARIFQYGSWPEPGMLDWIERQLSRAGISHAKLLYYDRNAEFFPFGFMVSKFLAGADGRAAVESGKASLPGAYEAIGKVLKTVHQIKIKKFGKVNGGKGTNSNFLQHKLEIDVYARFQKLAPTGKLLIALQSQIVERVEKCFGPFEKRFCPVLNHGDPNRENIIFTTDRKWVLIDWDNAFSSLWLEDFADISFWVDFEGQTSQTKRKYTLLKNSFFRGYGKHQFAEKDFLMIEHGLHIIKCLKFMDYSLLLKQNLKDFNLAKTKLLRLLQTNF